jgi:uncharacterized membrane protein YfcA
MTPAATLPKFFVVCSVILLLTGVAQFLVRPRKDKETLAERFINRSTITAVLSLCIGLLGLLFGLGVLPMPKLG